MRVPDLFRPFTLSHFCSIKAFTQSRTLRSLKPVFLEIVEAEGQHELALPHILNARNAAIAFW